MMLRDFANLRTIRGAGSPIMFNIFKYASAIVFSNVFNYSGVSSSINP